MTEILYLRFIFTLRLNFFRAFKIQFSLNLIKSEAMHAESPIINQIIYLKDK